MKYIHSEEVLDVPENGKLYPTIHIPGFKMAYIGAERAACVWLSITQKGMTGIERHYGTVALIIYPTVKVFIKSRVVTVEGPRGKQNRRIDHDSTCLNTYYSMQDYLQAVGMRQCQSQATRTRTSGSR